ncbi:MAG: hypothetical protein KBC46_10590 [Ferrovibrio sp.]|nr:hypothetical protein [Ferrovibrio sp.]
MAPPRYWLLTISDPWDFVSSEGAEFRAELVEWKGQAALLVLERPVAFNGFSCRLFEVWPRHAGDTLEAAKAGAIIAVNLTGVADQDTGQETIGTEIHLIGDIRAIG